MRFLFYDRVDLHEGGEQDGQDRRMVGRKVVALSEEFLPGHFTRRPILPGPVLIEAMAQVAGWLVNLTTQFRASAIMTMVEGAELSGEACPGDRLEIEARLRSLDRRWARASCVTRRDGRPFAALGGITFVLRTIEDPAEVASETDRFRYFSGWSAERVQEALARQGALR